MNTLVLIDLINAARAGLQTASGCELFLTHGIDAWALFSGRPVDAVRLRKAVSQA